jgi:catechol 2,3-dioxygenase-like lactoylglutathione lyase family enzyme
MADASCAGMNHVGLTVGDIDAAVQFYTDVFGLRLLDGPMLCDVTTSGAARRRDVFGERWGAMRLAHLLTANSCGLELFQFLAPEGSKPGDNFEYWRFGAHHIAFTVDNFDAALSRIRDHGGRTRTDVYDIHGGTYICYCEDPWGNVLEIVGRSYADLSAATTH